MDPLITPDTPVKLTLSMDASDALYLHSLCDRREAAMLSPFTGAEDLLVDDGEPLPAPATPG